MTAGNSRSVHYHNPVSVLWGAGAINELPRLLSNSNDVLFLYGQSSLVQSGMLTKLLAMLEDVNVTPLGGIPSLPDIEDVAKIVAQARELQFDTIVAVGGGSVIDTAKAVQAFLKSTAVSTDDMRAAIHAGRYGHPGTTLIAVPTVAGSGSEVTRWATIWDRRNLKKYSVEEPALYPHFAVVDPALTQTLSHRSATISAMDALCHAVEAYWAAAGNELSRSYALAAIPALLEGAELLAASEHDGYRARELLSTGSLLAGQAFSHTRTTACHAISYPLTLRYGIEHGIATAMTLSAVLALNMAALPSKEDLFRALGISRPGELQDKLEALADGAGFSLKLRDHGVRPDAPKELVPLCYTKGRMDNNPVPLSEESILSILESIY